MNEKTRSPGSTPPPNYNSPLSDNRSRETRSTHSRSAHSHSSSQLDYAQSGASPRRARSVSTNGSPIRYIPPPSNHKRSDTYKSNTTKGSGRSGRPALYPSESSSTLVGSAFERKVRDEDPISDRPDTSSRLDSLRDLMRSHDLDYYVIPSEDYHGSEYIAPHDKRREWISGFTGSAGQAVVSRNSAYLITDSRYWLQAREQLDHNWVLVEAGNPASGVKDWTQWIIDRAKDSKIGIDARLISYETATALNSALKPKNSKLHYPPQNLVDLVWREKPPRSKEPIYVQPQEFTGMSAGEKLARLREWVRRQRPTMPSYSKSEPKPSQMQVATLISNLSSIAWMLNLRGDDIPFNPVFHSYLFVGLDSAVLFIEEAKLTDEVKGYLTSISVTWRDYNDLWTFLRRKEWGEGNVIIPPQTSYAICLMMTSFRYTVLPSYVDEMKAVKNDVEINGLRNAYLRDGAAYVRWLAWLEQKLQQGYDITEYEAAWRLTEYRRKNKHYMGLAYENISATGPNAALPHYVPHKATARMIDRDTPYLNDSGGQYRDGTCDTTRTVHFGRPTPEQCEAFTRVLQGHIAIDSAIFPEGTSGAKLDVLARKALWQDGLNYMHGTGHGFGSFLNVHEGPQSFSSDTVLVPGHVITNEPGYYNAGKWGMRIESALAVRRVKTKGQFNGDIWLGFERLTVVPIQTKMVKEVMLSKEERQWLKDHNRRCLELLEPFLRDDKRALRYLRREAERGIGIAGAGPGGLTIDWD
ncbi:Creatinase/aminopeptidase [Dichomitus squalens]|uniref:Creatinase/aminopeptidase n=1 Tax=Dichomitus squalens TaxID=114155 RepID=A0A4Q9NT79_9APHY|nr:Creatinase/aminopeptidase [Dichomitus squalens LYAD-421 SS1]EJF65620.1 Creatinase/aminopeptidase [Dichomitus squalens LYAD-421 SS1]TBU24388.1 Creatinase/aminopeptidase [Dichomitus squalens]TBU44548.1 Creatinase/aminopeptidase [Dichomitus squalens]TBU54351.1 Creatinase/aminopeptidase [Dichomitus squalens]